jgi:hypothetical protein
LDVELRLSCGMFQKTCRIAFTIAVVLPSCGFAISPELFPMSKGTYWIYRGEVKWQYDETVKSARVEWKMEVVETIFRTDGAAAVLKGGPWDLPWFQPNRERGDYLLVRIGQTKFYLLSDKAAKALERLKDPSQLLADLVDDSDLILQFPLKEGARFGEADQLDREDGMYAWRVERPERVSLRGIKGSPRGEQIEYSIAFLTNPEHTYISFVPGIGITGFLYGHHGTVSEVWLKLLEFHPNSHKR